MASDNKAMCINHSEMIQCVTNARFQYLSLKSQIKYGKKTVSDLEEQIKDLKRQLKDAKHDVRQTINDLNSQRTIVEVLKNLCNHEDVHVLKGEIDGIIDLVDSGDEDNPIGTNEFSGSDAIGATVMNSTTITPVKQGATRNLQLKRKEPSNNHDDLLYRKSPSYGDSDDEYYDDRNNQSGPLKSGDDVYNSDTD